MRRAALLSTSIAILAATPSAAHGQPAASPATTAPAAVQTQMTLGVDRIGKHATVLVGDKIHVRGTVAAYVPGERVTVRFYSNAKKVRAKTKTLSPAAGGAGSFEFSYRPDRLGTLTVRAFHAATETLGELRATGGKVDVIPRSVTRDADKRAIGALQRRLSALGYVTGDKGSFDARTGRAVLAFRKVTGMRRTSEASRPVMRRIAAGRGRFKIRKPDHGRHIEADLTRQVIALIDGGRVRRIYPISSGAPSTPTILGSFRVYQKSYGTNAKGMVHSAYFIGGYATHGFASVPVYPASHGCLRVPISDALNLYKWIRVGTPVDVYHGPKPK
ncbi:MAG: L,D-transpeptidase [Solirubrobacterales bacterium]|nr:L,D-transpeptidase [Solirubrobacterales bacterium]